MQPHPTPPPPWINGIEPAKELLAMNGTQILEFECREQPARLADLLHHYASNPDTLRELATLREITNASDKPLFFLGMGGSFCSAVVAASHLQSLGRAAFALDAGEFLHYAHPLWSSHKSAALSTLLTTSGESAELVELLKKIDSPTALLCNNPASTGWNLARHRLPILAGPEYGNATKTFTNSTAAAIILASELANHPWQQDARIALDIMAQTLNDAFARRDRLEQFWRGVANTEIIGRGPAFGTAIMGALTIREMSGHRAAPHTGAAFRHGPNLDTDSTHLAIILATGRTAALGIKLAKECNKKGGKVLLISHEEIAPTEKLLPFHLPAVPEPWESLTTLPLLQALALAIIEQHGCKLPPRFQYGVMEQ